MGRKTLLLFKEEQVSRVPYLVRSKRKWMGRKEQRARLYQRVSLRNAIKIKGV